MPVSPTVLACFGAAFVCTLVLAGWLTPRAWWRRANLRALSVLGAGTAVIGCLLLLVLGAWPHARPPAPQLAAVTPPAPQRLHYRVYDDLNLRAARGTGAARIAVVPVGSVVTATGVRDGDWWQVQAQVDGRLVQGWASSLWLRRADERRPPLAR